MAKITIHKKEEIDYKTELSSLLDFREFETSYPARSIESWRRFDPDKILRVFHEKSKNSLGNYNVSLKESIDGIVLENASQWKKTDEVFLKKAQQKAAMKEGLSENHFFETLIANKTQNENLFVLKIKKDTKVNSTGEITISPENIEGVAFYNLIIYCEENSEVTLNILKNTSGFSLGMISIFQEGQSRLNLRILDESFNHSTGVEYLKSFQEKYSVSDIGVYATSIGQSKKLFIENNLMEYAQTNYSGLFNGKGSHVDHDFHVLHTGSFSKSNILFKMAAHDDSYGIFWGDTRIIPGTSGCEGYQSNKNLILGQNARVDAIPRLEIETENVVASHGSATGDISDEEIFYMMSRGLTRDDAQKLLLRGFFEDILRKSFGTDNEGENEFLQRIWSNIEKVLGIEISEKI